MFTESPMGRYFDGRQWIEVYAELRISPAQSPEHHRTIDHGPVPPGAVNVAISGSAWYGKRSGGRDRRYREGFTYGQMIDELRKVKSPRARRIAELWDRWHLNEARPNCAHMVPAIDQHYTPGYRCPANLPANPDAPAIDGTGRVVTYTSGSAWLFEPVPDEVLAELRQLFGKPEGWTL